MRKRLLSVLTGVILLSALIQVPASAEVGYYWIEAEEANAGQGFSEVENNYASGGKLMTLYQTKAPEEGEYTISFELTDAESGSYDIWFLSGAGSSNGISKFKWKLNDGEVKKYVSTGEENSVVYKQKLAFIDQNIQWNRVVKGALFNDGENKIDFIIDEKAVTGSRSYINLLDSVVIVPSGWQWQPDSTLARPEPIPTRFAWIELEAPDSGTRLDNVSSREASGSSMLYAYGKRFVDDDNDVEKLFYNFEVESSNSYDIWYLGCGSDNTSMHLSGLYWDIDGEPEVSAAYRNENPQNSSLTILQSAGATSSIPLYWQKMGTRELSAGTHKLYLTYAQRTLSGETRSFIIWADCAIIIPTEWGWTPPADQRENILPDYTAGYLAGKYLAEKYFTDDYSALVSDIELPENLKTPIKGKVSFESDKEEVIDSEGRVTRPLFSDGNAVFNYNICIDRDGKKGKYPIPMTVLKLDKYDISEISVTDETGSKISDLKDGAVLTASVDLKLNVAKDSEIRGKGTLLMTLFDRNGVLISVSMGESEIDNNKTTVSANMTLPEDVSGMQMKVYLLNGLNMANQLADSVVF